MKQIELAQELGISKSGMTITVNQHESSQFPKQFVLLRKALATDKK